MQIRDVDGDGDGEGDGKDWIPVEWNLNLATVHSNLHHSVDAIMILMFQQVVNIMLHVGMGMGMIDRVDMQRRDGVYLFIDLFITCINLPTYHHGNVRCFSNSNMKHTFHLHSWVYGLCIQNISHYDRIWCCVPWNNDHMCNLCVLLSWHCTECIIFLAWHYDWGNASHQ